MVVYEATTEEHLKKIVEFSETLPPESYLSRCWQRGKGGYALTELSKIRQGLQIFVCEDDQGKIRVVWMRERRGPEYNPLEPKMGTMANMIMDYDDYVNKEYRYMAELSFYLIKYNYYTLGIRYGEHWFPAEYIEMTKAVLAESFDKGFQILREEETPIGKVYFIRFDFAKILGLV